MWLHKAETNQKHKYHKGACLNRAKKTVCGLKIPPAMMWLRSHNETRLTDLIKRFLHHRGNQKNLLQLHSTTLVCFKAAAHWKEKFSQPLFTPQWFRHPYCHQCSPTILSGAHIETGGMVVTPPFTLSCIRMFFQSFNHEELVCCLTSYHVLPLLFIIQMSKQLAALLPSACLNMQTLKDVQLVSKYWTSLLWKLKGWEAGVSASSLETGIKGNDASLIKWGDSDVFNNVGIKFPTLETVTSNY